MQTGVRRRLSAGTVLVAAVTSLVLAGCTTSLKDPTGLVAGLFRQSTGVAPSSVSCPNDIPIAKGYSFTCTVHAGGQSHNVTLTERTADSSGSNVQITGLN